MKARNSNSSSPRTARVGTSTSRRGRWVASTLDVMSQIIVGNYDAVRWRVNAPLSCDVEPWRHSEEQSLRNGKRIARSKREAVCWRVARWVVLGSMAVILAVTPLFALDPRLPPGGNFDLSHWKLTLPDGAASEVNPAQLEAGFTNQFFYTSPVDGAMTFWCPVTGGASDGTLYPRSELREMLDPADQNVNWPAFGTNILTAQCRVTKVPSTKEVIIGQIHSFTGNAYPLVKLQYDNGVIEAFIKPSPNSVVDTTYYFGTNTLGSMINYQLKLVEGVLTVTVNGSNRVVNIFQTDPAWRNQEFYFKAGSYCQDNVGSSTEGATVAFYQLETMHLNPPDAIPQIVLTNCWVNAERKFVFTMLVPAAGNYFVQRSTDQKRWTFVLVTNTVSERIGFVDSCAAGAQFYRGGSFVSPILFDNGIKSPGKFGFTLIGSGAGNYFVQSSTDLVNWNYLLFTNSPTGWIEFTDTMGGGRKFYRGGSF